MDHEVNDLYEMALGDSYTTSKIIVPSVSSENHEEKCIAKPVSSPDYASLFRQLLVGARNQISGLKKENERLSKNLENALTSGGVVVCPHCTHHFKDRQCVLRPRTMKKMRARNCVELEFSNEEDLEAWLYLNQLETNNDGLPTVFRVKKTEEPKTLKEAGSLLPELVKKKKEELKRLENAKTEREKMKKLKIPLSSEKSKEYGKRKKKEEIDIHYNEKKETNMNSLIQKKRDEHSEETGKSVNTSRKEPLKESEKKKKPMSERIGFPNTKRQLSPEDILPPKTKRTPIYWKETPSMHIPSQNQSASISFKIPEKKSNSSKSVSLQKKPPTILETKFKFVPTIARKNEKKEENVVTDLRDLKEVQSTSVKTENVQTDCSSANGEQLEKLLEIGNTFNWNLLHVKKSSAVLEHIRMSALRRQKEGRLEVENTIVINQGNVTHSEENSPKTLKTLEGLGVSKEGLEILRQKLTASQSQPMNLFTNSSNCKDANAKSLSTRKLGEYAVSAESDVNQDGDDLFKEFFPTYPANFERIDVSNVSGRPTARSSNYRYLDTDESETGSITSVTDQEEDELMNLVRADTAAPPNGDDLSPEDDTLVQQEEEEEVGDGFCLEDVEDCGDESEFLRNSVDGEDRAEIGEDWMFDMENVENSREYEEYDEEDREVDWINQNEEPENVVENMTEKVVVDSTRSESRVLEMNKEFRLSDDDDAISPVTSTPKKEVTNDEEEDDDDDFTMKIRDNDSFWNEELDWNYGTEFEEEEEEGEVQEKPNEEELEKTDEQKTVENREDGEIIEDEEVETKKKDPKPTRKRMKLVVDEKQICVTGDEDDDDFFLNYHEKVPRRNLSSRQSSEENSVCLSRGRVKNKRMLNRGSLLKHKNS